MVLAKLRKEGTNETFILKCEWTLEGVKILLLDGQNAWSGEFNTEQMQNYYTILGIDENDYRKECETALSRKGLQENFSYCIEDDNFIWKKVDESDKWKFGSVKLSHISYTEAMETILHCALENLNHQEDAIVHLKSQKSSLEGERLLLLKKLEEYKSQNDLIQNTLYSKFLTILNAKKMKIRLLEQEISGLVSSSQPTTSNQNLLKTEQQFSTNPELVPTSSDVSNQKQSRHGRNSKRAGEPVTGLHSVKYNKKDKESPGITPVSNLVGISGEDIQTLKTNPQKELNTTPHHQSICSSLYDIQEKQDCEELILDHSDAELKDCEKDNLNSVIKDQTVSTKFSSFSPSMGYENKMADLVMTRTFKNTFKNTNTIIESPFLNAASSSADVNFDKQKAVDNIADVMRVTEKTFSTKTAETISSTLICPTPFCTTVSCKMDCIETSDCKKETQSGCLHSNLKDEEINDSNSALQNVTQSEALKLTNRNKTSNYKEIICPLDRLCPTSSHQRQIKKMIISTSDIQNDLEKAEVGCCDADSASYKPQIANDLTNTFEKSLLLYKQTCANLCGLDHAEADVYECETQLDEGENCSEGTSFSGRGTNKLIRNVVEYSGAQTKEAKDFFLHKEPDKMEALKSFVSHEPHKNKLEDDDIDVELSFASIPKRTRRAERMKKVVHVDSRILNHFTGLDSLQKPSQKAEKPLQEPFNEQDTQIFDTQKLIDLL